MTNTDKDYTEENLKQANEMMTELEELAKKSHSMTHQEANQIVNDLGRIIVFLSESGLFSIYRPESLLPREKSIVFEALAVCFKNSMPETEYRNILYNGYFIVREDFVADKEALGHIYKMLSNPIRLQMIIEKHFKK